MDTSSLQPLLEESQDLLSAAGIYGSNFYMVVSGYAFLYKLPICLAMFLALVIFRLIIANLLYVRRHDKRDWIIWSFLVAIQLFAVFIAVPWLWFSFEIGILAFMVLYALFTSKVRKLKSMIYSSNIVHEDMSDKYALETDSEAKAKKKRRDAQIKMRYLLSGTHMVLGMPVLKFKFSFQYSGVSTQEQRSRLVANIQKFYRNYDWQETISKNGEDYEIMGEVKVQRSLIVPLDHDLSDELPWYAAPAGVTDLTSKETIKASPLVWFLQDPKKEGISFKALEHVNLYESSPHGYLIGSTGHGKSSLLNTFIAHWVNKAKTEQSVDLYLCDAKGTEFTPYKDLSEIKLVATELDQAVDLTSEFVRVMVDREELMKSEGITDIPLSGEQHLNNGIMINDRYYKNNDVVVYRTYDGKVAKDYAANLEGRSDIEAIEIPEENQENADSKDH